MSRQLDQAKLLLRISLAWALLIFLTVSLRPANAQVSSSKFREAVSIDVETQVVKTLETAREHMLEGQWDTAVSILQELIDSSGDTLIPVEPGRYSNTADYCHLLISQFPEAGLTAYRNRIDSQANEWFESGRDALNETPLLRVVHSAFNSSVGDDALWLLGELAFEQGRFALARQYWSLLVPSVAAETVDENSKSPENKTAAGQSTAYLTHPDPSPGRVDVLARLVLCSIFEGDSDRAERELAVCRNHFPDETGTLTGRTGKFVEILSEVFDDSAEWENAERSSRSSTVPGGRLARSGQPGPTPKTQQLIWRRSIPKNRFQGPASRSALEAEVPSPFLPLVHREAVFVCGADSAFAFDLSTGRPRWPVDENDDGAIYTCILERPITPHLPPAGMVWYSLCLSEGRLYARMGPPIMRRSRNEGNSFSEIVGLDISQREGELVFHVTSNVLDPDAESPEATSWSFEGTPLVSDGRVYASARRGFPEDETVVACFDASSSRLLWKQKVCASLKSAGDRYNLIGQNLLTLGDGRLFLSTGTGAIAALDASTGRVLWVVTYQSRGTETPQELSDPRRHGLAPCVYDQGIVYAAPGDSDLVYALDATTGQPVWVQQYPDQVLHVVGVVDGRLILSGQSVWAVNTGTGAAAWPQRIGFADPAGRGFGRPALSHDFLYWPTRDEILRIDHRRGNVVERIRLREDFGLSGGNLVIADGKLLIAQPESLILLGPASDPTAFAPRPNDSILKISFQDSTSKQVHTIGTLTDSAGTTARHPDPGTTARSNEPSGLWPAQRAWQAALPEDSSVWFPEPLSQADSAGTVVTNGESLQFLDSETGAPRWSVNVSKPLTQVVSSGNMVAFADSSEIIARNAENGRLTWRRIFDAENSEQLQVRVSKGGNHFLVITESQIASLDPASGQERWNWPDMDRHAARPATSRFPAALTMANDWMLFRPAGSQDYGLINTTSGKLTRQGRLPFTAAVLHPLFDSGFRSGTGIIGLDSDNRIQATQLAKLGVHWTHKVPMATHGKPVILSKDETLIVVEDRQFATRLDPGKGTPLWRRPLCTTPLPNVSQMTVITSKELIAISDHFVRSFSLEDGTIKWEQYLGPGEWSLKQSNGELLCIQHSTSEARSNDRSTSTMVAIFDAATGQIIQRLRFSSTVTFDDVYVQSDRCIIRAGKKLVGFTAWPSTPLKPRLGDIEESRSRFDR